MNSTPTEWFTGPSGAEHDNAELLSSSQREPLRPMTSHSSSRQAPFTFMFFIISSSHELLWLRRLKTDDGRALTDTVLIVFSGRVNGRTYRADLELQADVAPERCSWEMKSNQPVLKLVKRQQGRWDRFLRTKVQIASCLRSC